MSSSEGSILRKAQDVGWVEAPDGVYVVVPADVRPFSVIKLSPTGASVWRAVDGRVCLSHVIDVTAAEWGMAPSDIADAVKLFADSLILQGIFVNTRA